MPPGGSSLPPTFRTVVTRDDLVYLETIKELLRALNDPYVGESQLKRFIEPIPVLAARCIARARHRHPTRHVRTVAQALPLIGNRGVEAELLTLLEDLTVVKSETE